MSMRPPWSRPSVVILLSALALLARGPVRACTCASAQCTDSEREAGCTAPPDGKQRMDIGFGTQLPGRQKPGDRTGEDENSGDGGVEPQFPIGSPQTQPDPAPSKPGRPSAGPGNGAARPRPADGGGLGGEQGTQAASDPQRIQAFAPRLHSSLSQSTLESKLRPLMERTQGPGEMPDSAGTQSAAPISWTAAAASGSGAAQGAPPVQLDALLRQGNYAGAERALTDQILAHPDNALAYRYRGMVRRLEKDYTGALDDAAQAIKLNPRDGWARDVRAGALVDLHRYPEAVEEANRAVELNPGDAKAYYTRASAWKRLGRREERLADMKKAAELDPEFAAAYNRALAAEDDDAGSVPLKSGSSSQASRTDGTILLYGTAGGGLLLILVGAGLLLVKSGATAAITRQPMRAQDRLPPAAPSPTLEGFEIIRKIGEGGMGVVYEAVDRTLRRKVALKQMRDHIAADTTQRKRFLREASTVASLKHPHVVEIHSAFETEGKLFLVFEFVAGEALNTRLDRGGLRPADALSLLKQIAEALDYAHAKGVIHQDLKPANIMVAAEGVKIMDFGIARKLDTKTPLTTSSVEIMGTPFYMAPEQESGETVKQSDLFALGVCAYEMLSGRRPFETVPCLFQKMEGKFTPLSDLVPSIPKSVDRVLAKAMSAKPYERHATARDFVADLEAALAPTPVA